ncbi:DUF3558 domain-containing protein [Antrihabitans spumae]|uniref:DUF3558 domain-containing protein n=1 Tax=Antrihabitans spumae TaxID=3373370 RepID=A0ABW7KIM6_9NOCA
MRLRTWALRSLALCGTALLAAGCSTTTPGSPVASSTAPLELFDPCGIPDDALRSAGVDPATEREGIAGAEFEGWKICRWEATAGWYFMRVYSTSHSLDEMQRNTEFTRFSSTAAGTRDGVTAVNVGREAETCNFGFAVAQGLIMVSVAARSQVATPEDPCTTAILRTKDLDNELPR